MTKFYKSRRLAVRSPHGTGKTALAAWLVIHFICTHPEDTKAITTASVWRQLEKYLWPEIRKWVLGADWQKWVDLGGVPPSVYLKRMSIGNSCEAFPVGSDRPELIEGAHATNLLYVFDESKAIPTEIWDAAEGAFSSGDGYWLAISTPGGPTGRFYDIHARKPGTEDWDVEHFTLDEAIAEGQIQQSWVDARKRQWGALSPVFVARVLGNFPDQGDDSLISLSWIEAARENAFELAEESPLIGLDVARFGDDDSCAFKRVGASVLEGKIWSHKSLMSLVGYVVVMGAKKFLVDEIGVGAGVVDRLREIGETVRGVAVSGRPRDPEHFRTLRDEMFWNLRERFQRGDIDLSRLSSSIYDRLTNELVAIKYTYDSSGKLAIDSKAKIKRDLGKSPDVADALGLCFLERSSGGLSIFDWLEMRREMVEEVGIPSSTDMEARDRPEVKQLRVGTLELARRIRIAKQFLHPGADEMSILESLVQA